MLRALAGEIESFARNRELLLGIESFCSESRAFARRDSFDISKWKSFGIKIHFIAS